MMAYAGDLFATIQAATNPPAHHSKLLLLSPSASTSAFASSPGPAPGPGPAPAPASFVATFAPALVFAGMGLLVCLAACAGLCAAGCYSWFALNVHLGLLALTMAGQVCMAAAVTGASGGAAGGGGASLLALFGVGGGVGVAGAGGGGGGAAAGGGGGGVRGELRDALLAYKWADAVSVGVEVLALLFGCLLHSAFTRTDERAEDLEEGLADPSAPLLVSRRRAEARAAAAAGGRTQLPPRVRRDDSWSRRMREQYGVDTSVLSYDPTAAAAAGQGQAAAAGAAETGGGAGEAAGGRCVIS